MRIFQTGTGSGQILGTAGINFYGQDGILHSFDITWDGESRWVPLLPGIAFDQEFPSVRSIQVEGQTLIGQDAQRYIWKEFEGWATAAMGHLRRSDSLPLYEILMLKVTADGDPVARAFFTVRINEAKQRLWGEATYQDNKTRNVLASVIYKSLWDWLAAQEPKRDNGTIVLSTLEHQFAYYREHGIPSDFRMREIGRAPFAALQGMNHAGSNNGLS